MGFGYNYLVDNSQSFVEMGLHVEKIRQFARHDSILTTQGYFAKFSPKDSAANKFDWM